MGLVWVWMSTDSRLKLTGSGRFDQVCGKVIQSWILVKLSDFSMLGRSTESSTKVDRLRSEMTFLSKSVNFDQI